MNDSPPGSHRPRSRNLEGDLLGSISEILDALSAVARGDLELRLEPRYPDTHPVGALALSVNGMVEALAEAKTRSQS